MKTSLNKMVALAVGCSIVLCSASVRAGTNDVAARMTERVEVDWRSLQTVGEMEKLWPNEPRAFFQAAERFAKIVSGPAQSDVNAKKVLLDLFDSVLQKECPTDDQQAIKCFDYKYWTIMHCAHVGAIREDKLRALAVGRFLGEVRARRIPNYKARATRFAGMDILDQAGVMEEGSLTNPVLKKAYKQAMEKNAQAQLIDDLQDELRTVDGRTAHFLVGALVSIRQRDAEFIARIADAAHLSEEELKKSYPRSR